MSKQRCTWPSSLRCDFIVILPKMQGHPAVWLNGYGTAFFSSNEFQGTIKFVFFSKQIIEQERKKKETKGKKERKIRKEERVKRRKGEGKKGRKSEQKMERTS